MRARGYLGLWALAGLLLAGCSAALADTAAPAAPGIVEAPVAEEIENGGDAPADEAGAAPTATPHPIETPLPTATPAPTHPLMIEVMRQAAYPGSPITFEETLQPGANYDRYIVSYRSEGYKIYALLTIPWGETPPTGWPVVIFNHGFIPPAQYRTTERYIAYQDAFAQQGYIVFRSDYRGHGSSEGRAGGGYGSPAYTVDVLNGLAAVKTLPAADPNRIGMWGHSMGGHITLRAMVVSDEIRAGVIWGGVVGSYPDLIEHWWGPRLGPGPTPTPNPTSTRGRWRTELIEEYGYPEENPEFWASISPNSYVHEISGPVQLHHGTADRSVPPILSEILYAELQAAGIPAGLYLYENDNHDISAQFATAMQRSIQFFDTYVKGAQ